MIDRLTNIKIQLGIVSTDTSSDTQLALFMKQADKLIKNYVGYDLEYTEDVTETFVTDGHNTLFHLARLPIEAASVVVKNEGVVVSAENYTVDYESGIVAFYVPPVGDLDALTVTYNAGYTVDEVTTNSGIESVTTEGNMPADLQMVFFNVVKDLFNKASQDNNLNSESWGDHSVSYKSPQTTADGVLSPLASYERILNQYKRYAI